MPAHDIAHDPIWADATFTTDLWEDPAAATRIDTASFIASLDLEPGLLVDTLHPFDGVADQAVLDAMTAEADAEVAELLGQFDPQRSVEVVPGRFFEEPRVTSWAA